MSVLEAIQNNKCKKFEVVKTTSFLILLSLFLLLLEVDVIPGTRRGFFCDDESLRYPYIDSTIPTWLLIALFWGAPNILILVVEFFVRKQKRSLYLTLVMFNFNIFACLIVTDIIKASIGRLRPHFIDACSPDVLRNKTCASFSPYLYITDYRCTNPHKLPNNKIIDTHKSFPSGHASMSLCTCVFLLIYIWRRLPSKAPHTGRLILFLLVAALSLFVAVTRVMNHKHHSTDVIGGAILGVVFALFTGLMWWKSQDGLAEEVVRAAVLQSHSRVPLNRDSPDSPQSATEKDSENVLVDNELA